MRIAMVSEHASPLAVLGGALAGFAMVWLGQRREPVAVEGEAADQPPSGRPVTT